MPIRELMCVCVCVGGDPLSSKSLRVMSFFFMARQKSHIKVKTVVPSLWAIKFRLIARLISRMTWTVPNNPTTESCSLTYSFSSRQARNHCIYYNRVCYFWEELQIEQVLLLLRSLRYKKKSFPLYDNICILIKLLAAYLELLDLYF